MAVNHLIGQNSIYDRDMSMVEDFIRSRKEPENLDIQRSVFLFYESAIYSYWNRLKDYLNSDVMIDLERRGHVFIPSEKKWAGSQLEQIRENFPEYQALFDAKVETLTQNFNDRKQVDIHSILDLFAYIETIQCLGRKDQILGASIIEGLRHLNNYNRLSVAIERLCPLPNLDGLFGLNTYLYAYFEDVFLVGIPNRVQKFDINTACPLLFLSHDIAHAHNINIEIRPEYKDLAKTIYYRIVNDSISRAEKELHILILWLVIHEIRPTSMFRFHYMRSDDYIEPFFYLDSNPIFLMGTIQFFSAVMNDLEDDWYRFATISSTEEITILTRDLLDQYLHPKSIPEKSVLWWRLADSRSSYLYENNPAANPGYFSQICTFIYSWNYVRTHYLQLDTI